MECTVREGNHAVESEGACAAVGASVEGYAGRALDESVARLEANTRARSRLRSGI